MTPEITVVEQTYVVETTESTADIVQVGVVAGVGSQGPQGYQGYQGAAGGGGAGGSQGPQGYQGDQGGAGAAGPQGYQGFQGVTGTGAAGPQGYQGFQGFAGAAGPQGYQGSTGTGAAGPQGFQGTTGSLGPQGYQGSTGTGATGPQGYQGVAGSLGPQGYQGSTGTGSAGPQGYQGTTGSTGPQGYQGVAGSQGAQGYQGVAGSLGPQGYQGSTGTGAQGYQGTTGSLGPQGYQGFQGVAGSTYVYNIRTYGAVGDGTTDDRAAIQAAIDAASAAGGGDVIIPSGTFAIVPSTPLTPKSKVRIRGLGPSSVLKVKNDAGDYPWIFYSTSLLSDFTLSDLWIDQNAAGNTTCSTDTVAGHYQIVVYLPNFQRVTFERLRIDYTGVNCLWLSGQNGSGNFATDVAVIDCSFFAHRGHTTDPTYDSSTVYTQAIRTRVIGNTFQATVSDLFNGTIEIHGPEATVADNVMEGLAVLCYVVQGFDSGNFSPERGVTIANNSVTGAANAIQLACTTGYPICGVTITGNTIHLSQATRNIAQAAGIIFTEDGTTGNAFERIAIGGNTVVFETPDTRTTAAGGAALNYQGGVVINPTCPFRDSTISGNTVVNSPATGIFLGNVGTTVSGVTVTGNTLVDCGHNANYPSGAFRAAFVLRGSLNGVRIANNTTLDTGASALNGLYYLFSDATPCADVFVGLNTVHTASGAALATTVAGAALQDDTAFLHSTGNESKTGTLTLRSDAGLVVTSVNANQTPGIQFQDLGTLKGWCLYAANNSAGSRYFGFLSYADYLTFLTATASPINFGTNGSNRWQIDSTGHLYALTDNAYDIGNSTSVRPRTLYLASSAVVGGAGAIGTVTLAVHAVGGQTADLQQWQNSGGTPLAWIDSAGVFHGTVSGGGTVTSVGLTAPTGFSVTGSPVTGAGTLGITTTLSGMLKGTGSGLAAATYGTDYGLKSRTVIQQGTTSYTVPSGTKAILVECIGAGGAGGGAATATSAGGVGGGGGSGGYAAKFILAPQTTAYVVAVGAGGTAGTAGANAGNNGGDTTFSSPSVCTAKGGSGGAGMASGTTALAVAGGAAGASASGVGDVTMDGTPGEAGSRQASGTAGMISGAGGSAPSGGGGGGALIAQGAGAAGGKYGGGGSGGCVLNGGSAVAGGAGANGLIIVWEFA